MSLPFNLLRPSILTLALAAHTALSIQGVQAQTLYDYQMAPGPLGQTLLALSRQSGVPISFDPALVESRSAAAVQGRLSIDEALRRALAGNGLSFEQASDGIVIVKSPSAAASQPAETSTHAQLPKLDAVVVIGSQRSDVTTLSSMAPVDAISGERLQATGAANLNQALQRMLPSFNFPQSPGSAIASLYAQGASLRGLSPDQVLVLVNGKRRHTSAMVKSLSDFGRGSQPVDLSTIPLSAIERVEVLRDGASAQYGSDAIAGVVNIVLKERDHGGEVATRIGKYSAGDGFSKSADGWLGLALPGDGFLTLSFDSLGSKRTSRAYSDDRQQYFDGDEREASARRHVQWGSPQVEDYKLLLNGEVGLSDALRAYGFASYDERQSWTGLIPITPNDDGNVRSLYPNGFQPTLATHSTDAAITTGLRYEDEALGRFDLSLNHGRNAFDSDTRRSLNASLGEASPTHFGMGRYINEQSNLDFNYARDLAPSLFGAPVTLSAGVAYRHERYRIEAGDDASWSNGGVPILDGPNAGQPAPIGAQGGSGLQPLDESTSSRGVWSAFAGLESQVTEKLQVGAAARSERYSDFGSTSTGKLSARYDFTPQFALRSAISTGYHAPSLGQANISSTSITFDGADVTTVRVVPVTDPVATALGAKKLKAETSKNISLGLVWRPLENASLTVDTYQIEINDGIAFSEVLQGPTVEQALRNAGIEGVQAASFFTNAVDTRTRGVDVVGQYQLDLARYGDLELRAGFNYTKTRITGIKDNPSQLAGADLEMVGREARGLIEEASPRTRLMLGGRYNYGDWTLDLNANRYGHYRYVHASDPTLDQTFSAQWVVDLDLAYHLTKALTVAAGANNLFDSYPDKVLPGNRLLGFSKYSDLATAGSNGAFYYTRLSYSF